MEAAKFDMFRNRLVKTYRHLHKIMRRQQISCYRLYDHDLPEFPLCVEIYESRISVAEYRRRHPLPENEHEAWLDACVKVIGEVVEIPEEHIYVRQRQRKSGRQGQYQRIAHQEEFFQVKEGGLSFLVNLSDYLDTGLFLDHRITRSMVRDEAKGKRVLNLFCYTGSFSVYAAAGGASEVVSVDLSNTYLAWAERNFRLNGFGPSSHYAFVKADVLQYLGELPASHYDLVIMDPPTFSNSKMMKSFLDIQQDHVSLINQVLKGLRHGGTLYFSTNYSRFTLDETHINSPHIKDITRQTTPPDFSGKLDRYCFKIVK